MSPGAAGDGSVTGTAAEGSSTTVGNGPAASGVGVAVPTATRAGRVGASISRAAAPALAPDPMMALGTRRADRGSVSSGRGAPDAAGSATGDSIAGVAGGVSAATGGGGTP